MACNEWMDPIVGKLYGEIDEDRLAELDRHLLECAECSRELADLEKTRLVLSDASPSVPDHPGVIILGDLQKQEEGSGASRWRRPGGFRMFAAGFAAAMLLLAAGVTIGMMLSPGKEPVPSDLVNRVQMEQALDAREARLINLLDQRSGQVQDSMVELSNAMESRRREDFRLLLGELITSEMWTGKAINENRESLRHLALASQPGVTEW
jgi:hypothetical protein